jgi:hypothetical protein
MTEKIERVSTAALAEVKKAMNEYCAAVLATGLSRNSKMLHIAPADNFVRWLSGEFSPDRARVVRREGRA